MRLPWPFGRDEERASGYTDAITDYLLRASGKTTDSKAVAAVEIAVGLWGRAFASAEVSPDTPATRALTAAVLGKMGRRLCLTGEAVFELRVEGDALRMVEASTWTITGGPDPDTWQYEMTFPGPSAIATRSRPSQAVAHVMYESDPNEPWRGRGPLHGAQVSEQLISRLEARLAEEASQPVGYVLPVPDPKSSAKLLGDLQKLKGELTLVESMAQGWDQGRSAAPAQEWTPRRLGFDPPEVTVALRDSTAREVLAACGVPVTLLGDAQGTAAREAFRQFLHTVVQPVSLQLSETLGVALDTPDLAFSFDRLMASDLQGRARAFGSLVTGGMELERAAALSGLLAVDDE